MRSFLFGVLFLIGCAQGAPAAVIGQEISYQAGEDALKGYVAYDDSIQGKRPGILVVHEWWGHNDYARKRADMLASLGYVALAVDMYGDGKKAQHPDEAGAFMKEATANSEVYKARFMAAHDLLKGNEFTDANRIAAIGYCFGGSTVLKMAMAGADLKGVVSFHGSLGLPDQLPVKDQVKAKVLVCHGGDDQFIPAEQVAAFKQALDDAGADYTFNVYEGAKHSFTNPDADALAAKFGMSIAYNAAADNQSWEDMQGFFKGIFQK